MSIQIVLKKKKKKTGAAHDNKGTVLSNWKKKWYEMFDLLDILQTSLSRAATKILMSTC